MASGTRSARLSSETLNKVQLLTKPIILEILRFKTRNTKEEHYRDNIRPFNLLAAHIMKTFPKVDKSDIKLWIAANDWIMKPSGRPPGPAGLKLVKIVNEENEKKKKKLQASTPQRSPPDSSKAKSSVITRQRQRKQIPPSSSSSSSSSSSESDTNEKLQPKQTRANKRPQVSCSSVGGLLDQQQEPMRTRQRERTNGNERQSVIFESSPGSPNTYKKRTSTAPSAASNISPSPYYQDNINNGNDNIPVQGPSHEGLGAEFQDGTVMVQRPDLNMHRLKHILRCMKGITYIANDLWNRPHAAYGMINLNRILQVYVREYKHTIFPVDPISMYQRAREELQQQIFQGNAGSVKVEVVDLADLDTDEDEDKA